MREVCFLIDRHERIVWADASTSASALPDSRARWQAIWRHRDELAAIAHSHPCGPDTFSAEDLTTMAAIDSALGRALAYFVISPRRNVSEPWWADLLRLASGMKVSNDHDDPQHHVSGYVGRLRALARRGRDGW